MGRPQSTPTSIQGQLVDALRTALANGWTQTEIADALRGIGVPYAQRTVSDWAREKAPIPERAAFGLAEIFGLDLTSQTVSVARPNPTDMTPTMDPRFGRLTLELGLDDIVLAWLRELSLPMRIDDATARAVVLTLHQAARTVAALLEHARAHEEHAPAPPPPKPSPGRPRGPLTPETTAPPTPAVNTQHTPSRPDFMKPKPK